MSNHRDGVDGGSLSYLYVERHWPAAPHHGRSASRAGKIIYQIAGTPMKTISKALFQKMGAFIGSCAAVILLAGVQGTLGQPVCVTCPPNSSSYTLILPPGWSLIANPFSHYRGATVANAVLDERVAALFSRVPTGTRLYKFDNTTGRFIENVFRGKRWTNPNETLSPGEGALFFNPKPAPLEVTITGVCNFGGIVLPKGLSLISSPACANINFAPLAPPPGPVGVGWDNLAFNPQEGDEVYTFNNVNRNYQTHHFHNGTWDSQPFVGEGKSCFVRTLVWREIAWTAPRPY
jgi:hypothetical protein